MELIFPQEFSLFLISPIKYRLEGAEVEQIGGKCGLMVTCFKDVQMEWKYSGKRKTSNCFSKFLNCFKKRKSWHILSQMFYTKMIFQN